MHCLDLGLCVGQKACKRHLESDATAATCTRKTIKCMFCGSVHVDSGHFALYNHARHRCMHCGLFFKSKVPCVGIEALATTPTVVRCQVKFAGRLDGSSRGVEHPEVAASTSRSDALSAAHGASNLQMKQADAMPPSSGSSAEANAGSLSRSDEHPPPPLLMLQAHL